MLAHALVLSLAGVLVMLGLPSAASSAPSVQDGRFLSGGTLDIEYSCTGADANSNGVLDALVPFGVTNPFPMPVTITQAAVEPSPSPGESFDMDFTWDFTLDPNIVYVVAALLGIPELTINAGTAAIAPTSGATGSLVANTTSHLLVLGDGSQPVGFTDGPHTGTFTRTAAVDEPIVFTPGNITSTVVAAATVQIVCTPGAGTLTSTDQDGVAPSTTTTTRPVITTTTTTVPAPTTTAAVLATDRAQLPRTGSSSLLLVGLALALIDLGYLALSASRSARQGQVSSAH